jgi:hypothetical protein
MREKIAALKAYLDDTICPLIKEADCESYHGCDNCPIEKAKAMVQDIEREVFPLPNSGPQLTQEQRDAQDARLSRVLYREVDKP